MVLWGWLFLLSQIISAQQSRIISSIEFVHNSYFSKNELLEQIPLKKNSTYSSDNILQTKTLLQKMYYGEGFYSFRVDSDMTFYSGDSLTAAVTFYLYEGKQVVVSNIVLHGNAFVSSAQLLSLMTIRLGVPLHTSQLESDVQTLLTFYSNNGFPFTKISSEKISMDSTDSSRLIVQLVIEEGPKLYLDEIQVQGNSSTRTQVVAREARLEHGELFHQEKLDRIKRRLERSQLFSSVSDPQLYVLSKQISDSMQGGILINVREGGTNTFDGIVGYVPAAVANSSGYFTGNIYISMRNLFGTGRRATVQWMRENETTQEFQLHYQEPWLFDVPLNAGISFFQRKQDSSYVKTKIDFRMEYAVTEELSLAGNFSTENVYPSADLQQFSVFESKTLLFGGEIHYDTRDNLYSPRSGVRYSTAFAQGSKTITGPQKYLYLADTKTFSIQKYSLDAEVYLTTFIRQVLTAAIHGKQTTSSQLEISDLFSFGGTNSVRGYRENQFFASRLVWMNLEYRLLTGRVSSFFAFFDAGYFSRSRDVLRGITFQENNLYGYGVGARVETGLGIMSVSYAIGKGDNFSNGKIHVGIINEF